MSAPILAVLLGVLYSILWFKYLRYKFYTKLSENKIFYDLLLCKLCAGFWAGVLGTLTCYLLFGGSNLIYFLFIGGREFWDISTIVVKVLLAYLGIFGGIIIFFDTKVGTLVSTYGDVVRSSILALLIILHPLFFPNYLTTLAFFGFVNAALTFMIFNRIP
jgi:hypothetical protein